MKLTNVLLILVVLILVVIGFEHHQTMVRERNSIQQIANDTHNELARQDKERRFAACMVTESENLRVRDEESTIINAKIHGIDTSAAEKTQKELHDAILKVCSERVEK
jgi:predicted Holliday junction resolvase-like endonuclease